MGESLQVLPEPLPSRPRAAVGPHTFNPVGKRAVPKGGLLLSPPQLSWHAGRACPKGQEKGKSNTV